MRLPLAAAAAAVLAAVVPSQGRKDYALDIAWNRLYDYDEVTTLCDRLQATWPKFITKLALGQSSEGRTVWMLVVNQPDTGADTAKPAFYSDANIHGNEVQGAETNLYLVWYLMEHYGKLDRVTELVDRVAWYIVPSVNVDARAHWFAEANTSSSFRSGAMPLDSDGDGLKDEDPADDLDGDGHITRMRKRVPLGEGTHREMRDHPGVMERVRGDVPGDWILLGSEGIDNDGDGRVNEDGPGGYDMNRNWPSGWAPGYIQFGAGNYPLSQPETRGIADFILEHPNIAGAQAFHNAGGMILRGPGHAEYGNYPAPDVRVYDELGKDGEFMLPFYRYMVIHKDLYTVWGGFVNWTYEGLGIFSFTNEMWSSRRMMQAADRLSAEDRRRWDDLLTLGENYRPWQPYEHPLYGAIEIGGSAQMTGRLPPTWLMEEELHRNAAFVMRHAEQMPEPILGEPLVRVAAGGLRYVDVEVRNDRLIPTRSRLAADKKIGLPDRLEIAGPSLRVIAGGEPIDRHRLMRIELQQRDPARLRREGGVPSRGVWHARWIVAGAGPFTVHYRAEKGRDQTVDGSL
ncbi:MAG: M14 family metallopeptidase [Planctomycetota bacterium]